MQALEDAGDGTLHPESGAGTGHQRVAVDHQCLHRFVAQRLLTVFDMVEAPQYQAAPGAQRRLQPGGEAGRWRPHDSHGVRGGSVLREQRHGPGAGGGSQHHQRGADHEGPAAHLELPSGGEGDRTPAAHDATASRNTSERSGGSKLNWVT